MKHIIFLGPPGSGKGTQAHFIANKYKILNISAGTILRQSSLNDQWINKNSKKTINTINAGNLVDDKLVTKLIIDWINQNNSQNGFILDGFPRTIGQAILFKNSNISINFVIEFRIPDFIIIDRIVGRQIHIDSGRTYHIKYNPPKYCGLDDITGEKLIIRTDDNLKVIQQRLNQYRKYTIPLSNYYKKESKKGKIFYFCIDGNRQINMIYEELINILSLHMF